MIFDYCNGLDLQALLRAKRKLNQVEISIITRKVVCGCKEIWDLNIIHRDIKLANILLHFPDNPEIDKLAKTRKMAFLKEFDLTTGNFKCYISDFGLSTIRNPDSKEKQSICGTPLYSSPQLLERRGYSYKVDVWALGIMCYELLMGQTPFHSQHMKELIQKINTGDFSLELNEPVAIECALFLTQCLQANEEDRLNVQQLMSHPFINPSFDEEG